MANIKKTVKVHEIPLPRTATSDLRGRQSVRATFKLSEGCIDAISIVATHLGIKQKSLFDHLLEDTQSLMSIAQKLSDIRYKRERPVQKTYVLSRRSLSSLDQISRSYNAPRDALVEFLIQRLTPIIAEERTKHEKRKKALVDIESHLAGGLELLQKIKNDFGVDDPLYQEYESVMATYVESRRELRQLIERGKVIEGFDPEVLLRNLNI